MSMRDEMHLLLLYNHAMFTPLNKHTIKYGFACLLCALLGCGGKNDSSTMGTGGIQSPANFIVSTSPLDGLFSLRFSWTIPPTVVDGFNLQGKYENGDFQPLTPTLIPSNIIGGTYVLNDKTPELSKFIFRIDSVKGSQQSDWVETSFDLGVFPATQFTVSAKPELSTIHLAWTANSVIADSITLQRTAHPPGGSPIATTLALPVPGTTSYDDKDTNENYEYEYSLTYNKGDVSSVPATSGMISYGLNAPRNLVISAGTSNVNLSWALASTKATEIRIYRQTKVGATSSPSGVLATLPIGARQFTDPGLTPGIYSYEVSSYESTNNFEERSGAVTVCIQPAPLDGQTLQGQYLSTPETSFAQIDGQGNWLLCPADLGSGVYGLVTWTPTGSSQQALNGAGNLYSEPVIVMDSAFQPHVAYGDAWGNLFHTWRTDAGWQTETVATGLSGLGPLDGASGMPFLQASDGSLHLLYRTVNLGQVQYVEAIRGAGGWSCKPDMQLGSLFAVSLDPLGNLYGLQYGSGQSLILWCRGVDGKWSSQLVPGGGALSSVAFQVDSSGTIHLVFVKPADSSGPQGTVHYYREAGVWSKPEFLTAESAGDLDGSPLMYLSCCSQDQRLFYSSNYSEGTVLFARDPNGTWSSTVVLPKDSYPFAFTQGVTVSGKVYLAIRPMELQGLAVFMEQ